MAIHQEVRHRLPARVPQHDDGGLRVRRAHAAVGELDVISPVVQRGRAAAARSREQRGHQHRKGGLLTRDRLVGAQAIVGAGRPAGVIAGAHLRRAVSLFALHHAEAVQRPPRTVAEDRIDLRGQREGTPGHALRDLRVLLGRNALEHVPLRRIRRLAAQYALDRLAVAGVVHGAEVFRCRAVALAE